MRYIAYAFWLIVLAIAVGFVVLNWQIVTVDYYTGKIDIFFPLLLLIVLLLGTFLGAMAMLLPLLRARRECRRLTIRVSEAELEIKNLRHIPIKDNH